MMISIKKFLRPLVIFLLIIFGALSLTGCASVIRSVSKISKAQKVINAVELKRNVGELADKILDNKR